MGKQTKASNKQNISSITSPEPKSKSSLLVPIIGICAALLTAIAFYPMLSNQFTNWDDQFYVTTNKMVREFDWNAIWSQPVMANYHPLTMTSLALNYQWSEFNPYSYHLVNFLLHILNTVCVFYLIYKLSNNNIWVAALTSLLFGIHPMHVESVAWASERKDVLYSLFFLLSLIAYTSFIESKKWLLYFLTIVLFVGSLLSKPAAVTLPLILVLLDWYKQRNFNTRVIIEKIPFFILSLVFGLIAIKNQSDAQAIVAIENYPFWQKIVFSIYGFGEYIKRLFWPFPLSAMHPFPSSGMIPMHHWLSIAISAITIFLCWKFRSRRYLIFGLGFYALNIFIVLQLLTFGHAIIAERYTYVPYIGLAFALSMFISESNISEQIKRISFAGLLFCCVLFAFATNKQTKTWKDPNTLWTQVIRTYPDNYFAHSNRGHYNASKLNNFDAALQDYAIALKAIPNDSFSLINRATIYINQRNYPKALSDADSLVKYHPRIAQGHLIQGAALFSLGHAEEGLIAYTNCIQRDSFIEEAWSNRGVLYYNSKQDVAAAKFDFDKAILLNPKKGINYKNRARCWLKLNNKSNAIADLNQAKALGMTGLDELYNAANAQ